jgi:type 1 glutamine amidotransferase
MKKYMLILSCVSMMFVFSLSAWAEKPGRILVFAKTKGFYHSSIPAGMITLMKICGKEGITVDTTRDAAAFTSENLKQYQVVVFLNTTGDVLNDSEQEAFTKYIQAGGGFVGIHAATDTEYDWPWYNKLVGAYFLSHPAGQPRAITRIVNRQHPATSFLPEEWERTDEWYNFKSINPDIQVLAYLDETSYKGGANGEKHPFIWCHEFDGGRAFYTGGGHLDANFEEELFRQHLLEAIKWAGKM